MKEIVKEALKKRHAPDDEDAKEHQIKISKEMAAKLGEREFTSSKPYLPTLTINTV